MPQASSVLGPARYGAELQHLFSLSGAQPLVHQGDGQPGTGRQLVPKLSGRIADIAVTAVHVQGQPDHQFIGPPFPDQLFQFGPVRPAPGRYNGREWFRRTSRPAPAGSADSFQAEVEAEYPAVHA